MLADKTQLAQETVRLFYSLLTQKEFSRAWGLLSPAFQSQRSFDGWRTGYETTAIVAVLAATILEVKDSEAEVGVEVASVDVLPSGQVEKGVWRGNWRLIWTGNRWLLDAAEMELVGKEVLAPGGRTIVHRYEFPEQFPDVGRLPVANCWVGSLSSQRPDAFRCMWDSGIMDPCFLNGEAMILACPGDPRDEGTTSFVRWGGGDPSEVAWPAGKVEQPWFLVLDAVGQYYTPLRRTQRICWVLGRACSFLQRSLI